MSDDPKPAGLVVRTGPPLDARSTAREMSARIAELAASINAGTRRIDAARQAAGVAPGEPLLGLHFDEGPTPAREAAEAVRSWYVAAKAVETARAAVLTACTSVFIPGAEMDPEAYRTAHTVRNDTERAERQARQQMLEALDRLDPQGAHP